MKIQRFIRHLLFADQRVRREFPPVTLQVIEQSIHSSEQKHGGEIRFAVEGGLDLISLMNEQTPRERAVEVFSQLGVWDTEHNNGVLIYVLLADHAVEIVADRGIHVRADSADWSAICRHMQTEFSKSAFEAGALKGIEDVTNVVSQYFPPLRPEADELSNAPVILSR